MAAAMDAFLRENGAEKKKRKKIKITLDKRAGKAYYAYKPTGKIGNKTNNTGFGRKHKWQRSIHPLTS